MLSYHLRHAARRLFSEPAFTITAILTLGLGVGANVAVFEVVEAVLLRPLPYPESDRLVLLNHRDRRTGITKEFIALGDYADLSQRQRSFDAFLGYGFGEVTVTGMGDPFRADAVLAGGDLLGTVGLGPALGRTLEQADTREGAAPVALLGYDFWQTHFGGDRSVIGRGITINQRLTQIVGVAPPGFRFPLNHTGELVLPLTLPEQAPAARRAGWTFVVARLRPGVTVADATDRLGSISRQLEQEFPRDNLAAEYFAVSLRDGMVGETRTALWLMLGAVTSVLLIACANVTNLLLARALGRRQEMAVRTALGAGMRRLVLQIFSETVVLALAAGIFGTAVAYWGGRALVTLVPGNVSVPGLTDIHLNVRVLAFAFVLSVSIALACGLVSAVALRMERSLATFLTPSRAGISRATRRATSGLVTAEVALAIVLLIGAGLIIRSLAALLEVDPGFRTERVVRLNVSLPQGRYAQPEARRAFYGQVLSALRSMQQVEDAGAAVVVPLTGNNWTAAFERPEHPVAANERPPEVGWQQASGGYFTTLGIPLITGRLFGDQDTPDTPPVVIVSESIQRQFFGAESAVGHEIVLGPQRAQIVGVVGDIRRASLRDRPRADLYFPFERSYGSQINLFIRTRSDPARAIPDLRATLRQLEPGLVFLDTQTLRAIAGESVQVTRLIMALLITFAVMALVLAAVGVYGVMSYAVRQRTREIGTRVALGASRTEILRLMLREGGTIAAIGIAGGSGAALLAMRALRSQLFGIAAWDPLTITTAAVVLGLTTVIACYIPARRAAAVDPARVLGAQ